MSKKQLAGEVYYPSDEILKNANAKCQELYSSAEKDYLGFWESEAGKLNWFKKWDKVLDDSNKPFFKWFINGKTNIAYNCLDVHCENFRRNKIALFWEGENGDIRSFSYFALRRDTCRFANVLKSIGVKKGDRVTIYMGRIPEAVIAMLACARIGAIHSVVYGGFSVEALHERLEDSQSKILIVADGAFQRGKIVELKKIADEALQRAATVESVLVVKRTGQEINMEFGRDMWYHELVHLPIASSNCDIEEMDAEDPLFLLYTSGTTGKPP